MQYSINFSNSTSTGQRLPTGQELVSRASQFDLGMGIFRLKMQSNGNLVQYPVSTTDTDDNAYYDSGTKGKGDDLSLNLDNDGRLYLSNGTVSYNITTGGGGWSFPQGSIYIARVGWDGIFRLHNLALDHEGDWTVIWSSTEDRCAP